MANAAHHIDSGDELILIPTSSVGDAAPVLAQAGGEVLWALRTGDSRVGMIVVVSGQSDPGVRDQLLHDLQPAGAWRVSSGLVMDRETLLGYCRLLLNPGSPAALPSGR